MGAYLGPQEELEVWVKPKVEAWAHGVRALVRIAKQNLQSDYSGLGILLQLKLQYLQGTVPGVGMP